MVNIPLLDGFKRVINDYFSIELTLILLDALVVGTFLEYLLINLHSLTFYWFFSN